MQGGRRRELVGVEHEEGEVGEEHEVKERESWLAGWLRQPVVGGGRREAQQRQSAKGWWLAAPACSQGVWCKSSEKGGRAGLPPGGGVLEPQQEGGIEVRPPLWLLGATLPTSLQSAGGVEVARCEQPCPAGEVRR